MVADIKKYFINLWTITIFNIGHMGNLKIHALTKVPKYTPQKNFEITKKEFVTNLDVL